MAIIIWIICAVWCYSIAKKQGRNPILAAILGLLFALVAVIGYYIAGDKNNR